MDMDIMDTMESVRLRLSPRLLLIPTFCMLDMATTDKLYLTPTSKWTAKHQIILVSFISDHISVLDIILGDRSQET